MRSRGSEPIKVPGDSLEGLPARSASWTPLFGVTGSLLQQFSRYIVVGGLAFAVDIGLLYLLVTFTGINYLIAAATSFLLGLLANYWLSRYWVFDRRTMQNVAIEFAVFTAIGIVGLGLNEVIIWFVRERIHFHLMIAKTISAGIILVWNFGARKLALFR